MATAGGAGGGRPGVRLVLGAVAGGAAAQSPADAARPCAAAGGVQPGGGVRRSHAHLVRRRVRRGAHSPPGRSGRTPVRLGGGHVRNACGRELAPGPCGKRRRCRVAGWRRRCRTGRAAAGAVVEVFAGVGPGPVDRLRPFAGQLHGVGRAKSPQARSGARCGHAHYRRRIPERESACRPGIQSAVVGRLAGVRRPRKIAALHDHQHAPGAAPSLGRLHRGHADPRRLAERAGQVPHRHARARQGDSAEPRWGAAF